MRRGLRWSEVDHQRLQATSFQKSDTNFQSGRTNSVLATKSQKCQSIEQCSKSNPSPTCGRSLGCSAASFELQDRPEFEDIMSGIGCGYLLGLVARLWRTVSWHLIMLALPSLSPLSNYEMANRLQSEGMQYSSVVSQHLGLFSQSNANVSKSAAQL